MKVPPITIECPGCHEPLTIPTTLTTTSQTVLSEDIPNAEGGARDVLCTLKVDTSPLRAHVKERHS